MAVQLVIDYEQVLQLVEQLSEAQQDEMMRRLLAKRSEQRPLTHEEKIRLFDAAKIHHPINDPPSVRREDWYGDDGR